MVTQSYSNSLPDNSSPGQRYHVVVEASPKEASGAPAKANAFWVRTIPADDCSAFPLGGQPDERQGIIYYGDENSTLPISGRNNFTHYSLACRDEDPANLVPIIPWEIGPPANTVGTLNLSFDIDFLHADNL